MNFLLDIVMKFSYGNNTTMDTKGQSFDTHFLRRQTVMIERIWIEILDHLIWNVIVLVLFAVVEQFDLCLSEWCSIRF